MTRRQLSTKTIGELCEFESGHGFRPLDWKQSGLPIIRIQNLNGSNTFNYFDREPDPSWIVEPGDLLFAWAGVKGVSFGPTIWSGPRGVLNQHIYRIRAKPGVNKQWLYYALSAVTVEIEKMAHGFKTSLVHVRKADITRARVTVPTEVEQARLASALMLWDAAIRKAEQMAAAVERRHKALLVRLLGARLWHASKQARADALFVVASERRRPELPVLAVTQDQGVVPRSVLDRRIAMALSDPATFKVVKADDFVISLRSFEGGLEHSAYEGLVSPAYTVLRLRSGVAAFYRHYLKSPDFLKRIAVAVVGIRDGKQINFSDFASIKLPLPSTSHQLEVMTALDESEREVAMRKRQAKLLRVQRDVLTQKLLTGEWQLPIEQGVIA